MRKLLLSLGAMLILSACGGGSAPATPTAVPNIGPTSGPTATRPPAPPPTATPAPQPSPTPEPEKAATVWVGNTDGEGVFLRTTPVMADRVRAYPDGTELTIIGDEVDGDGQHWLNVKTPDGLEGYVPSIYTRDTPP